jgi:hypothetical protein
MGLFPEWNARAEESVKSARQVMAVVLVWPWACPAASQQWPLWGWPQAAPQQSSQLDWRGLPPDDAYRWIVEQARQFCLTYPKHGGCRGVRRWGMKRH